MRTITIDGKQLPFRLSYRALKGALRTTGLSMQGLGDLDLEHIGKFGVEAINSGYQFEKKDTKITLNELEDLLDADFGGLTAISEAIGLEMEAINAPKDEGVDVEKK
jgi:hypothetical protein